MTDISIDPNVWGPSLWDALFYICFNVDVSKHYKNIQTLFHLLEVMLPCSHCRRHYSIYKKQVPPVSNIKKDERYSSAMWLWIIHDMVNQNLGKICISYEKLEKKHKSLTCIVSDFTIFDIVVFMWMSSKNNPKVFSGVTKFLELLSTIQNFKACEILKNKVDEKLTFEVIHECKNELLTIYNYSHVSLEEMIQSYKSSIAT